ncbi:hypothetical protein [Fulvimarina sp. MAC3]|uniref:hypothetical protein n=1 Tax=Fulvimarina sp. MAC3 TaxID=3148887 RepID=UPI0031FBCC47
MEIPFLSKIGDDGKHRQPEESVHLYFPYDVVMTDSAFNLCDPENRQVAATTSSNHRPCDAAEGS